MSSAPHDSSEIKLKYGNSEWVAFWPVDAESYPDDHEWGDDDGWAMRIGIPQTGVWLQHDGKGGHIPNEEGEALAWRPLNEGDLKFYRGGFREDHWRDMGSLPRDTLVEVRSNSGGVSFAGFGQGQVEWGEAGALRRIEGGEWRVAPKAFDGAFFDYGPTWTSDPIAWRPLGSTPYRIFLDGDRSPIVDKDERRDRLWVARTYDDWVHQIQKRGCPEFVTIGEALGDGRSTTECVTWLADWVLADKSRCRPQFRFHVHSNHSPAASRLTAVLKKFRGRMIKVASRERYLKSITVK